VFHVVSVCFALIGLFCLVGLHFGLFRFVWFNFVSDPKQNFYSFMKQN
jgi:hypothetical protein